MTADGIKLIVGLGNPGLIYAASRHNIGFRVVKYLARSLKIGFKADRQVFALVAKGKLSGQEIVLALPQTYMNLSGRAVSALLKKFKLNQDSLLVVCDDLDLELGRLKIRPQGASGGQRGLESIIQGLGSQEFSRLRIGIGRPAKPQDAAEYVLSGFSRQEKEAVRQIEEDAADCCQSWVENGITQTMNIFNNLRSRNE
jgi:PTH1 family peptidyl-tRNA hydrolase